MVNENGEPIVILMAEDDLDDQLLTKDALEEARLKNEIRFVSNGLELLDYLQRKGEYSDPESSPTPEIILLDLNMPKMDGREALAIIKADDDLRHIPIVILTTSSAEEDIFRSYNMGVNSYVTKPVSFEGLTQLMKDFSNYWFTIVKLPQN